MNRLYRLSLIIYLSEWKVILLLKKGQVLTHMGFFDKRAIRKYEKEADRVLAFADGMQKLSDEDK